MPVLEARKRFNRHHNTTVLKQARLVALVHVLCSSMHGFSETSPSPGSAASICKTCWVRLEFLCPKHVGYVWSFSVQNMLGTSGVSLSKTCWVHLEFLCPKHVGYVWSFFVGKHWKSLCTSETSVPETLQGITPSTAWRREELKEEAFNSVPQKD